MDYNILKGEWIFYCLNIFFDPGKLIDIIGI